MKKNRRSHYNQKLIKKPVFAFPLLDSRVFYSIFPMLTFPCLLSLVRFPVCSICSLSIFTCPFYFTYFLNFEVFLLLFELGLNDEIYSNLSHQFQALYAWIDYVHVSKQNKIRVAKALELRRDWMLENCVKKWFEVRIYFSVYFMLCFMHWGIIVNGF